MFFIFQSDAGEPESPVAGHGKRMPVPSLCAQRDNMIGDKENSLPVFTEKRVNKVKAKAKAKCRAADDVNDGRLAKKAKLVTLLFLRDHLLMISSGKESLKFLSRIHCNSPWPSSLCLYCAL